MSQRVVDVSIIFVAMFNDPCIMLAVILTPEFCLLRYTIDTKCLHRQRRTQRRDRSFFSYSPLHHHHHSFQEYPTALDIVFFFCDLHFIQGTCIAWQHNPRLTAYHSLSLSLMVCVSSSTITMSDDVHIHFLSLFLSLFPVFLSL